MDSENYCRLCLHRDHVVLNVFSEAMMESEMLAKIEKYLYLEIKETDLAKTICVNCVRKIEETHNFCVEVHQNQEKLLARQNKQQFQILFDKNQSADNVSEEVNHDEPYDMNEELYCEPIINDLHFADVTAIQSPDRSPEYQIMLTESPETRIVHSPRPPTEGNVNEVDCFDTFSIAASSNEYDDRTENDFDSDNEWNKNIEDFPKVLIKDAKLALRGQELFNLMSKFYKLQCEICQEKDSVFIKIASLLEHYEDIHSTAGYVKCCGVKLITTRRMAMHMAKHVQPDAFTCSECGKLMNCPKNLQYHMLNHLPEEKRPWACPKCPRRFGYSGGLATHKLCHLPEDQRGSHRCTVCGKGFVSANRLATHVSMTHSVPRYVCHECGKQFSCKGNLSYHLTTHEEIHQVQCTECKNWFKNKFCLRKHMAKHSEVRHKCPSCDYSSTNLQCYRNHLKVQHSNDKPHVCKECGRSFKLKNTLLNHIFQHTGERKYTCEFCMKRFASSGNYYSHRKRMHPNELAEHNEKRAQAKEKARELALKQREKDGT